MSIAPVATSGGKLSAHWRHCRAVCVDAATSAPPMKFEQIGDELMASGALRHIAAELGSDRSSGFSEETDRRRRWPGIVRKTGIVQHRRADFELADRAVRDNRNAREDSAGDWRRECSRSAATHHCRVESTAGADARRSRPASLALQIRNFARIDENDIAARLKRARDQSSASGGRPDAALAPMTRHFSTPHRLERTRDRPRTGSSF